MITRRFSSLFSSLLLLSAALPLEAQLPVANPKVWLRADQGVVSDGNGFIERWEDQSGNNYHFTQATAAKRPKLNAEGFLKGRGELVDLESDQNGNSTYSGVLGIDFIVDEEVDVTHLAAFDHLRDGIQGTITVKLWSRQDNGTPRTAEDDSEGTLLEQLTFTNAAPGDLVESFRWKALPATRRLAPGSYTLTASGYTGSDAYYTSTNIRGPKVRGISIPPDTHYGSNANNWPSTVTSYGTRYGGAANLRFTLTSGTPSALPAVAFDGTDDGLIASELLNLERPSSVFIVYEAIRSDFGYIAQNATGNFTWQLRTDGYYSNGWVRYNTPGFGSPQVAGFINNATESRAFAGLDDVTTGESFTTGSPTRLAIGGGEGRSIDAFTGNIAEVVAFDRQLTPAEIRSLQRYFGDRYGFYITPAATPQILPPGDLGSGNVSVSLSSATTGAQIRYTTNGTEPTESSTLYSAPFSVARGTQVKARAFLANSPSSGVATQYYAPSTGPEIPPAAPTGWFRADLGVVTDANGGVSQWNDLTGNGNDFFQGVAAARPSVTDFRGDNMAIRTLYGDEGASTHPGSLGADFEVIQPIEVTHLAAFDHRSDGFVSPVTVQLLRRDDRGTPRTPGDDQPGTVLAELEFTPASPGTLSGPYRLKALTNPVTLAPGTYTIQAWGYTGGNLYRNSSDATWNSRALRFTNVSRYSSTPGAWSTTLDSHPVKYNGAGNFRFQPVGGSAPIAAVSFDGNDDGMLASVTSNMGRPSTLVFVLEYEDEGRFFQNSSNGGWYVRAGERYSYGNVSNDDLPSGTPLVAMMTQTASGTRFYVNGEDWTDNGSLTTPDPGRLAIGGAVGASNDPAKFRIAEVLSYNRELNASERWQVETYLNTRLALPSATVPEVVIAPASNFGTGPVNVTLTNPVATAQIRYTTDGSEPTASSSLYSGSFSVARDTRVRARAIVSGSAPGPISETYYGLSGGTGDLPLAGAKLWLSADRGVSVDSSGGVSQWADLSGNNNHFTQTTKSRRPAHLNEPLTRVGRQAILSDDIAGASTWNGSLGDDLVVDQAIELTELGAFDHNKDGFAGTITVEVWSRNNGGTPITQNDDTAGARLASLTFTSASPGTLSGNHRFKPLAEPLTLAPGNYTIFAHGYIGPDLYREGNYSRSGADSRFRFVGTSRYSSTPGSWPNTLDSGYLDYAGAANFRYTPLRSLPNGVVAFDGLDDGLSGAESMTFGRPSTVLVAFELPDSQFGYILQNQSGGSWWFRRDGYYANGWVKYENFDFAKVQTAAMVQSPTSTRAYRDGTDVTENANLTSINPGRLSLGGGEGQNYDPIQVRVAEVVAFDRSLDAAEIQRMESYFSRRYRPEETRAQPPTISPPSNYGSGQVTVTLTANDGATDIRYTTNGSEPTTGSTLYTAPFTVPRGTEVRAIASGGGLLPGTAAVAYYGDAASHPLPASGAALWLTAGRGVEFDASGAVRRWRDLSGNGRDLVQPETVQAPRWVADGFGGGAREVAPREQGRTGNDTYAGWIGTDFIVTAPLEITAFSVFDSAADGIVGDITVRLHSLNDAGTPANPADDTSTGVLSTLTFTASAPGTLDQGKRRKSLPAPLTLNPGRYFIESSGWTGANTYESSENFATAQDPALSYPAVSRYGPSNAFSGSRTSDNRYLGTAGFVFRSPGDTRPPGPAVRFDGSDDGMYGPVDYLVGRPSTVFLVFQRNNGTHGRLIQSGSGENWLLGPHSSPQGYHANGWVTQHTIRENVPSLAIAVQDTFESRYFYNGQDLTVDPNPLGNLGRVTLGGGEGTYNQPCDGDIAELVIYDRVLTLTERQAVSAALNARHNLPVEQLQPVVMNPAGGLYSSGRTVTLSHPAANTVIRYTTDGSEPTASSTTYSAPFLVNTDTVVKARAFADGYAPGVVTDAAFFIDAAATAPPQRSSMLVWLRAGKGSETDETSKVSRWRDLSGKGNHASQPNAAQRPTLSNTAIGGAPGLVFDGTDDFLQLPPGFSNFDNGFTAMVVVRPDVVGSWQRFFDLSRGAGYANIIVSRYSTNPEFCYDIRGTNGAGNIRAANSLLPLANAILTISQAPSGAVKLYMNGSLVAENNSFPRPQNILRYVNLIGKSAWSSDPLYSGTIAELAIYNSELGDLERETFEQAIRTNYGIASTSVGTVAFSPSPATLYPSGVDVTLTTVTPAASIRYTLDGSTPSETSVLYSGPFRLNGSARVRARAFAEGFNASAFSEATYHVGLPPSSGDGLSATYFDEEDFTGSSFTRVDPAIDFIWGGGTPDPAIHPDFFSARWSGRMMPRFSQAYTFYTSQDDGMRVWVDLNRNGTFEDATELLINDWNTGGTRERVSTPVNLQQGLLYDIKVEYREYNGHAEARFLWSSFSEPKAIVPQSQLFSNAEFTQTVATPVITPPAGTSTAAVNVTISTATSGATLYYTTDGSEPTTSSQVYTGSFTVPVTTTVRTRAYKAGFNPSGIATSLFTIDAQPPVIQTFTWNGTPISPGETFVSAGTLAATATDNQGVTSAEFYYLPADNTAPILIGSDNSPGNGLSATWNIANVSDGPYTVRVRVYDTTGTFSELSRAVNVALPVPPAPAITEPASGTSVETPVANLRVVSGPNENLRIFRDGVFIFSGYANSSGVMTYSAPLPTGTSVFHAIARNRAGNSPASNNVTVTRVREFPALGLSFDSNTVGEAMPVTGTVTIPAPEAAPVTVQITTSIPSRMETVPPVIIPAGATSATFTLVGRVDSIIQLLPTLIVTAKAHEHRDGVADILLADSPYPVITLELDSTSVSEDAGSVTARIRRAVVQNVPLTVHLVNTAPAKVQVPATVTIPGGAASAPFTILITDNQISDGNVTAQIGAQVRVGDTAVSIAPNVGLEVRDNDGPVLTLTSPRPLLNEGAAVNFTLRRQGGNTGSPLTVTLSQSNGTNLTLPATANFPANSTEIAIPVQVPVSATSGTRQVTARASAAGHVDGLALISVSDENLADLVPSQVNGPARVLTEQSFNVNYTVHNYGPVEITNPYIERILLSKDPTPSADDTVVRQVEQTGTVSGGGNYARNISIFAPREVGDYYLVVVVDPGQSVPEISDANNTVVSALPVQVRAAYSATVQTDSTIVPANTPIVFTGSATKEGGIPATFSMVNIHITSNGTNRVISAVTNSLGNFTTTWRPLQNEGGVYQIGACHPGLPGAAPQDEFEILTMGFDPPSPVRLDEGQTAVANAVVRNPNGRDLTGLQITIGTLPAGLTVTPQVSQTTVPAEGQVTVPLVISAAAGFSGNGQFPMTATTAEGVTMTAGLSVRADLLVPVLSIDPASLQASVLRGGSQVVSFTITNTGGLESGPVQVLLPNIPWITLASSGTLPSIPPGQSRAVSLRLAPDAEVDLTQFSGNLAVNAQNGGSRSVPYQFRVVSDLSGDLRVKVVDELYYFTEAAPALGGAQVTLRDAITSSIIAQATTAVDGTVQFNGVPEAWYRLEVSADRHDRYSNNYFLVAGQQSEKLVFISKQLVNYTWTVQEVEIQDVYRITVETTFETNVPAPVVTITPSRIDVEDLVSLGQSKVVNLTVTNEGFIAANEGLLDFSEHPFYEFTPLVKNVGSIPAKSSLVIPVTVRRIGVFDEEGNIVQLPRGAKSAKNAKLVTKAGGSVPCGAGGKFNYSFPCGPENPQKSAPIAVSGVQGNCGGGPSGGGGYIGFHGGYFNLGGGGGGGGSGTASGGGISFASADACDPCVQQAILECLLGFTPLGCPYSIGKCVYQSGSAVFGDGSGSDAASTCLESLIGCAADAVPIPGVGAAVNGFFCIKAVTGCGSGGGAGGGPGGGGGGSGGGPDGLTARAPRDTVDPLLFELGSPWTETLDEDVRSYASEIAPALSRMEAVLDYFAVIFGTRERLLLLEHEEAQIWTQQLFARAGTTTESGRRISPAERADLEAFGSGLNQEQQDLLMLVIDRWNRSFDYAAQGIYEVASVPAGQSIDFIPDSRLKLAAQKMVEATDTSRELGFADSFEEAGVAIRAFQQTILEGQGGTCSRVKIEISQDLVMTRTAFEATLQLENERDDVGVSDIGFDLQIRDSNGLPSEDLFNIQVTRLTGLGAIDGTGSLDPSTLGSVKWTLIPRDTAALTEPVSYTVGGIIRYTQDGNTFTIPVENVPITVRPDASLALKYFHQRDVYSDDPYTDAIEPAVPYKLAVMVENNGHGPARDLKIISGQPKIVENEKGLFIDFKIIGTEVDGQPLSPSLTAEFGTLEPGARSTATFLMTSTLQGLFIDYNATFEHVTGLGDPRISLLQSVEIHEMIRSVQALDSGRNDGRFDFLTNDVPDVNDYPDTIHYSDGGTDLVTVKQSGTFTGTLSPSNLSLTLNVGAFTGWSYIRVPDPAQGNYRLVSVQRADGRVLPVDVNSWQTDRTFIGAGRRPVYEHILHLADSNSTGAYTLNYQPVTAPDSEPPVSSVQALPAQSPASIPVFWSGTDNQAVAFYDIYVSSNGGPFSVWRSRTAEVAGLYPGTPGETYAFYSVATDFAGNRETKSAAAEATTTAANANQAPVIADIPNQSIDEGSLFTYQAVANDPDGANSLIRWSLGSSVPGITIDPVSGLIRWNTGESDGGRSVSIIVVATDAGSPPAVANEPFTITVNDVNSPPTITQVGPQTFKSGGLLIVDVDAIDGDSPVQSLTYSLANAPAGATINPTTGVITWVSPTITTEQTHLFRVMVTDSGNPPRSTEMSFSATVQPLVVTDSPPVFTSVPVVLWVKGTTYQLDVVASDPDGDPISLTASLVGTPGAAFADLGTGTGRFSWNVASVNEGTYQVPLTATANGKSANATLRVRVANNELYWNWVESYFGELPDNFDLGLLEKNADPDGDQRSNVHEMAFLTNPLEPDVVPMKFKITREAPFTTTTLSVHRRVGSENYVEFHPRRSNFLSAWQRIPITEYSALLDANGDDDNRGESQSVDFQIFEYFPTGPPKSRFYDIESVEKP